MKQEKNSPSPDKSKSQSKQSRYRPILPNPDQDMCFVPTRGRPPLSKNFKSGKEKLPSYNALKRKLGRMGQQLSAASADSSNRGEELAAKAKELGAVAQISGNVLSFSIPKITPLSPPLLTMQTHPDDKENVVQQQYQHQLPPSIMQKPTKAKSPTDPLSISTPFYGQSPYGGNVFKTKVEKGESLLKRNYINRNAPELKPEILPQNKTHIKDNPLASSNTIKITASVNGPPCIHIPENFTWKDPNLNALLQQFENFVAALEESKNTSFFSPPRQEMYVAQVNNISTSSRTLNASRVSPEYYRAPSLHSAAFNADYFSNIYVPNALPQNMDMYHHNFNNFQRQIIESKLLSKADRPKRGRKPLTARQSKCKPPTNSSKSSCSGDITPEEAMKFLESTLNESLLPFCDDTNLNSLEYPELDDDIFQVGSAAKRFDVPQKKMPKKPQSVPILCMPLEMDTPDKECNTFDRLEDYDNWVSSNIPNWELPVAQDERKENCNKVLPFGENVDLQLLRYFEDTQKGDVLF